MTGESNTPSNPAYNAASSAGTASLGQQYPDIEERKIRLAERLPKFSILHVIITGLAGLSGALAVAFISAKKDLEYQEREHRHKIIEQATQGVSP